jgi:hypothetical protein
MLKIITTGVVTMALASGVQAESWFQIEAGVGVTSAQKVGDGIFYSKGFSHSTPNGSYGGRAGVVLNLIDAPVRSWVPGLRMHADYYNFGKVKWSSMNPQDEADFTSIGKQGGYNVKTGACVDNNCGVMRQFNSTGGIQAIAITVEPFWNIGGSWQLGVEAGPALYRATWTSVATAMSDGRFGPAGTQETLSHQPQVQLGALAGFSVSRGPIAIRANYLYAPVAYKADSSDVPAGIKGEFMLSVNYTW